MQTHPPLPLIRKLGFGFGDVAVNISLMSMALILTYFYTDVFVLKAEDIALLFLVVRVLDAVTDILMGWLTDRWAHRTGRYRFWIGLGAIPFGLSIYLVFAGPELSYNGRLAWAYVTYVLNSLLFTVVTIPYISLIGVISSDPKERLSANAYRFVMAKVAVLLVTSLLTTLALWLGDGDRARGFGLAMALMSVLSTLSLLICWQTTREVVPVQPSPQPLWAQLKDVLANSQWRVLAAAFFAMMVGYVLRGSIAYHYAVYYLRVEESSLRFGIFMSMWAVGGIFATLLSAWLTARYCKVRVFRVSLWVTAAWGVLMYLVVGSGDYRLGLLFYFVYCVVSDINTPVFWASIADVAEYGDKQTGRKAAGMTFGTISFFQKFSMGVAGFMVGWVLSLVGYTPHAVQTPQVLNGIALLMTGLPAVFFLASGLIMKRYLLTQKYLDAQAALPAAAS